jgi:aminomethyltransferase
MKKTAFYNMHLKHGAKIVPFAGFEMPIQYSGIIDEVRVVRNFVGVFDVSHMGEIEVHGNNALEFVQRITTNDASKLIPGKVQYSSMCYKDGGIVDDLLVYNFGSYFMLVVNASNKDKDFNWMKENIIGDVKLVDRSDEFSLLAVQGPHSLQTLQKLTKINLSEIKYYSFVSGVLAGVEMVISRTGYTGELGFELYFKWDITTAEKIWNAVFEAGKEFGIKPVGLGARDTLRLEMGMCLYGNDIDQTTNPLEAGLGWITKLNKTNFNGKEKLEKIQADGLKRKLVGFKLIDKKVFPRHGYEIHSEGKRIGVVTSGTFSPTLDIGLGMGYVEIEKTEIGNFIDIIVRDKIARAKIVKLPFINKE